MLKECIPCLLGHLRDPSQSDAILNILVEISGYDPVALATFLPKLKEIGESFPSLIGQTAKIFGAVGHIDEVSLKTKVGWFGGWLCVCVSVCACVLIVQHLTKETKQYT